MYKSRLQPRVPKFEKVDHPILSTMFTVYIKADSKSALDEFRSSRIYS